MSITLFAPLVPAIVAFGVLGLVFWRRRSRGERPPVESRLLRPAGHSLRLRQEALSEDMMLSLVSSLITALSFGYSLQIDRSNKPLTLILLVVSLGLICAFFVIRLVSKARQYRSVRLGCLGEQMVAEELDPLREDGYRIFHDFPGGPNWNIDHIAIGPGGLFAIETKVRSKRRAVSTQKEHEVFFEGNALRFPWGKDCKASAQARRNAEALAKFVNDSTGESHEVVPLLVLPGWYVTSKERSDVRVISGRRLAKFIHGFKPRLTAEQIQRCAFQVEQKCRDVEF